MTAWCDLRMVAFDCETTGVDVERDRIVTASVAWVGGDEPTETLDLLVNPGVEIPAGATAVHGVTTAQAQRDGLTPRHALELVHDALDRRPNGSAVVCQNARFDLTILDREARRYGVTPLVDRDRPLHVVDIRVIDLWLDKYRAGKRTLQDLCAEYGARHDGAHHASDDAIAAARVAYRIAHEIDVFRRGRGHAEIRELLELRRIWDRVRHNLPLLHAAQISWAVEQAADLQRHFDETSRHEQVSGDWPIVPIRTEAVA